MASAGTTPAQSVTKSNTANAETLTGVAMEPCMQDRAIGVIQEQIKVANNRIADLEKIHECLMEMNGTLRVMAEQLSAVKTTVEGHGERLQTIESEPKEYLSKVRLGIVMTLIGLAMGYLWNQVM